MIRKKCYSCHKKQAYKKTRTINSRETYVCKFCKSKMIPDFHRTGKTNNKRK
jgi:predicted SprT family Zn-dependent metalloprotease